MAREPLEPNLNPEFHRRLARAYEYATHHPLDVRVKRSYDALKNGILWQWSEITKAVSIKPTPDDPYEAANVMFADIGAGHLAVFNGGDLPPLHPLLPERIGLGRVIEWNVMFRAVHDYFGHWGDVDQPHYPFGTKPLGLGGDGLFDEERAFRRHQAMFPREAWLALVCETRAQTAVNNLGTASESNSFGAQKACYLEDVWLT